jgi:Protein of unknown function (DUF4058)
VTSPFPGMDPWLEAPWVFPDVNESLIIYLRDAINSVIPDPYYARSKTRVWVERSKTPREPDVSVVDKRRKSGRGGLAVAPARPVRMAGMIPVAAADPVEEIYLDISDRDGNRLVTSVEVLSPSNKRAESVGRREYVKKQAKYQKAGVTLVEIDLLRAGQHTTAVPLAALQDHVGPYDYHVCVGGRVVDPDFFVAPFTLRDPLPRIAIPLDPDVDPVEIDLQPLLDRSYEGGKYDRSVEYDRPAIPPLTPAQQTWADGLLKKKRARK